MELMCCYLATTMNVSNDRLADSTSDEVRDGSGTSIAEFTMAGACSDVWNVGTCTSTATSVDNTGDVSTTEL